MRFIVGLFLVAILWLIAGWLPSSRLPAQIPIQQARIDRFGIYNWNVDDRAFPGGNLDRLNWGADKVAEAGTRTIRVFIGARDIYRLNPQGVTELAQLAATAPYVRLFSDPRFSTYTLTVYSYSSVQGGWTDGFTVAESAAEREEIRRLGQYLLSNSAFTGKTFIILNWEGDNEIYGLADKQSAWESYRDLVEARAEGVRAARAAVAGDAVKLYSGLEFNLVRSRTTGQACGTLVVDPVNHDTLANRCVIDFVAPRVSVDYYSYSAWQTVGIPNSSPSLNLGAELKRDIRFAVALVRASRPEVGEANFMIGEYGFERARYGECRAAELVRAVFDALQGEDGLGVSYAIFWQIIDNAPAYGAIDQRFGLLSGTGAGATRAGMAFQRALAGQAEPVSSPCPTIALPPPSWGVVDAATGAAQFRLNPDSVLAITSGLPFSAAGNTVHVAQSGVKFTLTSSSGNSYAESATRITAALPSGRRPGEAWVYVTNADGLDSNAQGIVLQCPGCPVIDPACGVAEREYRAGVLTPGGVIAVRGSFSSSGNTLIVEQQTGGGLAKETVLERDGNWVESSTEITAKLPADLVSNNEASIRVVDAQGRSSAAEPMFISKPCSDCAPVLRACRAVLNGESEEFHPGTIVSIIGRFRTQGNRVVIEQWNEQGGATRYVLDHDSRGWKESESRIEVGLPTQLWSGRAIVYLVDSASRESAAREIFVQATTLAVVSAASFKLDTLTPGGIVAAFGNALATAIAPAATLPLPMELAGTRVVIRKPDGSEHPAPIFFVSPQQVNFQIPANVPLGAATVVISSGDGSLSTLSAMMIPVAPGIFAANSNGAGAAAAFALHVAGDGAQVYESTAAFDQLTGRYVTAPFGFGPPPEDLYLVLFGTGFRARSALSAVRVSVGDVAGEVTYAGQQEGFLGLDQINVKLPRNLAGSGEVDVEVQADGRLANKVRVRFK